MGDAHATEETSGEELVVGREQGRGFVQDGHPSGGERTQRPQPVVDAVERSQHVQTPERSITGAEDLERPLRGHPLPDEIAASSGCEGFVRGRRPARDERKAHRETMTRLEENAKRFTIFLGESISLLCCRKPIGVP